MAIPPSLLTLLLGMALVLLGRIGEGDFDEAGAVLAAMGIPGGADAARRWRRRGARAVR